MDISITKDCIAQAKDKMNKSLIHFEEELKKFRAGKANTPPRAAEHIDNGTRVYKFAPYLV